MIRRLTVALSLLAATTVATLAQGGYPDKPIKVIVPYAAGGAVDVMARLFAEKAAPILGQPIVIENRAGASGIIGGQAVHQAAPDGATLLFVPLTHVMANVVLNTVPYDAVNDFTPVARVGESPMLVVISTKMEPTSLAQVAVAAREHPADWTIATSGLGGAGHVAAIELSNISRSNLTITPYRGTAPALTDVMGGHVQLLIDSIVTLLPVARDGKVKALAITSTKRSSLAPDIPTAAESGMPSLQFNSWYGFLGPKGLPKETVTKLNAAFNEAGRKLAEEKRLDPLGAEPVAETPEDFGRFIRDQVERNARLLNGAGFKPQ
ncbi:MAG: tripartite tricarboxylate transporter substrate binding protein [Hyphomicrobiales bacterium]|nr:tripartite tricarboxylate transporter substrate binding protein [Alphaproteobacteria bacterium]